MEIARRQREERMLMPRWTPERQQRPPKRPRGMPTPAWYVRCGKRTHHGSKLCETNGCNIPHRNVARQYVCIACLEWLKQSSPVRFIDYSDIFCATYSHGHTHSDRFDGSQAWQTQNETRCDSGKRASTKHRQRSSLAHAAPRAARGGVLQKGARRVRRRGR